MKTKLFLFLTVMLFIYPIATDAQHINTTTGTKLIYNLYDAKGKITDKDTSTILSVSKQGDNTIVKVRLTESLSSEDTTDVMSIVMNAFGSADYVYNPQTKITRQSFLEAKTIANALAITVIAESEKEKKAKLTESEKEQIHKKVNDQMVKGEIFIPIRSNTQIGETFASSEFSLDMRIATLKVNISDGKYLGTENIETPAGTFVCTKLSFTRKTKFMIMSETEYLTQWYSEGIGLIKEECSNKKGKIQESQMLIAIFR